MSDNITGFGGGGDEINLGLNLNSNVGNSINDFSTLDQVLQQMIKDQETFNGIQDDSFEKAKATTQEIRGSAEQAQQLISIFRTLRGEQQGVLQDAKQFASIYQQINNELQKATQNKTRLGITSPSSNVPGASSGVSSGSPTSSIPPIQGGGMGGGMPPGSIPTGGYAEDPDEFFGREEAKATTGRRSSPPSIPSIDIGGGSDTSLDLDLDREDALGTSSLGSTRPPRVTRQNVSNEQYKKLSDLALAIFPRQRGYYQNLRMARWLTRNEGGVINKFVNSPFGKRAGLAFNRLGGGQHLRTPQGYQLFPFIKNENGDYVGNENMPITGADSSKPLYGLQDENGNWLNQGGEGGLENPWMWTGEGSIPPPPTGGPTPYGFNPWERPNLSSTGEGIAKVAGATYGLKVLRSRANSLFQEGQLYTGITGGTGIAGALKYDLGAQATSWFGLNPLESYGQSKQITMQNLALGYRGNLLNRANQFGNQALQQYGVDPQTSMQMFGQMVMQAGVSLQDLQASLSDLATTASTTNTSFSQLQQGVIQYSQLGSSIGLTGGMNATFATATAQFAAGQPGLQATGANPADIMDSMVGQALVAQQMGTSYLGLPLAAQQQGTMPLVQGEVAVNESLMNRIGLNRSNYNNPTALANSYQKFKLLASAIPGMQKEANMSYANYVKYQHNLFSGASQSRASHVIHSQYASDVSGSTGGTPGQALARASYVPGQTAGTLHGSATSYVPGSSTPPMDSITNEMSKIQNQQHWKNIGISHNGQFISLSQIDKMPAGLRDVMMAKIGTGAQPLSHISQHGKLVQGNYTSGTLLDYQGHAPDQFNTFGNAQNSAQAIAAEKRAIQIELGPNAKKYLTLLEDPSALNRNLTTWTKNNGTVPTQWPNMRTANNRGKS